MHKRIHRTDEDMIIGESFFSIIMLPAIENRRLIMNTLEVILDKMMLYGSKIENPLLHTFYSKKHEDWIHNEPVTISELRNRSFFKRFTADDL